MAGEYDVTREGDSQRHGRTLLTLLPYLWPSSPKGLRMRVVIALLLLVSAKVVMVIIPFIYKAVVDHLNSDDLLYLPILLIVAYAGARVASQAFGELRDAVFAKVGQNALRTVALITFKKMHALSLRFHLERRTGGLSRVIERGTKGIDFLLRFTLFNILPTFLEVLMATGVLLWNYGWGIASITFFSVMIYIYFTFAVTEWRLKFRREMNNSDNVANTRAIDSLLNFETVKYFANEGHESGRFDTAMARYQKAAVKSQVTLSLLNIGQGGVIAFGLGAVMVLAANGVRDGSMTIGDFVLINTLMLQLYQPLGFLGFVYREIKQSLVDMEKMFELLDVEPEIQDKPNAETLTVKTGEVAFDNVSFAYDEERPILHNLSFRVGAGETVAIVGPSGAGKSTISRLLFRFYDASTGSVSIDGQDVRDVTQHSLRHAIGIVPQDTVLFNDTVRYNILYGRPDAGEAALKHAAKLARIDEFIESLPEGYDATVGERGLKLSGGEKQRVAIARTILKDPPILLFDEATSALDTATEREIQQSLAEVSKGRTTLVIAHRLSTIRDANEILVLDQGRVVERGSHDELVAAEGVYARMWERQQEAAAAELKLRALKGDDVKIAGTV